MQLVLRIISQLIWEGVWGRTQNWNTNCINKKNSDILENVSKYLEIKVIYLEFASK